MTFAVRFAKSIAQVIHNFRTSTNVEILLSMFAFFGVEIKPKSQYRRCEQCETSLLSGQMWHELLPQLSRFNSIL